MECHILCKYNSFVMNAWVWYYLKPKHSVNFLVFQQDKGISKNNYKKLVRGAIRLLIIFCKKQRKVAFIMKLAISNFRCPGETHITDFTRLPPLCIFVKQKYSLWYSFSPFPTFCTAGNPCVLFLQVTLYAVRYLYRLLILSFSC